MSAEVVVDALPYIDQGYDEAGVRDAAQAMVEEECRRYRPTKNYLEYLPALNMSAFETPLMTNEFERISNRQPMEPLSMKRYELPPPPPGRTTDLIAWQESVENSMAQLEHQAVRAENLELMLEYGCETWKAHLEIFTALQAKAQLQLQELKKDIQDVNWQRKSKQTQAGERLRSLEAQWVGLVSKNYEIEQACVKLEEIIVSCQEHQELQMREQQEQAAKEEEEKAVVDEEPASPAEDPSSESGDSAEPEENEATVDEDVEMQEVAHTNGDTTE